MTSSAHSEYIRYDQKSALIRRWIATILLKSDLEGYLAFNGLEPIITRGFDTSSVNKENREDAPFIRAWLKEEHAKCGKESFDEADVFAINTRRIQKSMGLNKVELAVLRFACLVNCYKPLFRPATERPATPVRARADRGRLQPDATRYALAPDSRHGGA